MDNESVRHIRNRYPDLDLSFDQAVKMGELEERVEGSGLASGRNRESFSYWEQSDYMLDEVRGFLTDSQLAIYEAVQQEAAREYEAGLEEGDVRETKELAFLEEYTTWLRESFVPKLLRECVHVPITFFMERGKIDYLRAEHKVFLARFRHNVLVRHYRQSRRLQPNGLKLAMLYQDRLALLPNYDLFIMEADEAVKAVGAFLMEKYSLVAGNGAEFFRQKVAEDRKQYDDMRMQHFGERGMSGWHVPDIPRSPLEEAKRWLMTVMLIDRTS